MGSIVRLARKLIRLVRRLIVPGFLVGMHVCVAPVAASPMDCEDLGNGTHIGNSVIVFAQAIQAGDHISADGTKVEGLPAFCRVFAVASPHPSSRILIEIWMPESNKWNGKLLGIGNGGAAGRIYDAYLAGGIKRGFAAATTDLGSYPAGLPDVGFNFGDGRPEARRDWAFRATHEMTVLAKKVIAHYFGHSAAKAYFIGCSTGGHQSLSEAEKYPEDYDGIIAGAPAHNRTHLHIRFAALRKLGMRPGAAIPPALMRTWSEAILMSCAGRDGGAPEDTFLNDPLRCTASPRQLACKEGTESSCLSDAQIRALESLYDGTRNPRTGELITFGDVRGAEPQFAMVYGDTPMARTFDITHWILPPEREWLSFDFDRDMAAMDDAMATDINAMNPDLSRFAARGGKLIMFHGWGDGLISPLDSIDFFQRIKANTQDRAAFARLFMVPGMGHCFFGPGATDFGQVIDGPGAATADDDILLALDKWSESGVAPEMLLARASVPPAKLVVYGATPSMAGLKARPICAFPSYPRYNRTGDPTIAASFACVADRLPKYERPALKYLR